VPPEMLMQAFEICVVPGSWRSTTDGTTVRWTETRDLAHGAETNAPSWSRKARDMERPPWRATVPHVASGPTRTLLTHGLRPVRSRA